MRLDSLLRARSFAADLVLCSLVLGTACDLEPSADDLALPASEFEDEALDSETPDAEAPDAKDEHAPVSSDDIPPRDAEEAGKARESDAAQDLAATAEPIAALGWLAGVSEETPPATCDDNGVVIWSDCMDAYCDHIQMFCGTHPGTATTRSWTTWFSEEDISYRICPGTQYVTGVACRGAWCDEVSIECTDLGLSAKSCMWSGYFGPSDPIFMAPSGHVVAGLQCKGAWCDELRYFTCEI